MEKKTICVDFDGVIAQYDGFKGNDIFGDPIDGVQSCLLYTSPSPRDTR